MEKLVPKLRFPEFDGNWDKKSLKEVVKVNQGLAILKSNRFNKKKINRFPYITIPYLEGKECDYIENPQSSVICKKEDILISRTGNGVGKVWTNIEGVFHNNFFKVVPKDNTTNKPFLFYYLNKPQLQFKMRQLAGSGAIPDLNHGEFYLLPFFEAKTIEQQKIASFLTSVDERLTLLAQQKEKLELYKKGVMQQIFAQKLRFKDDNGENYPDWEEKKLGDLGNTFNGLTGKTKKHFGNGKPYVQYMQIFSGSKININDFGFVEIGKNENQSMIQYGDIFFTTSSETPNEIGTTSVLLDKVGEVYLNSFCFGFRPNSLNELVPEFAQFLFRSKQVRNKIVPLAQGSTRFNMSKVELIKIDLLLPCEEEQQKIASFLSAIDAQIEGVNKKIEQTKLFKKGLLQQLFV